MIFIQPLFTFPRISVQNICLKWFVVGFFCTCTANICFKSRIDRARGSKSAEVLCSSEEPATQYIKCYNMKRKKYLITFSRKTKKIMRFSVYTTLIFFYYRYYCSYSNGTEKQTTKHLLPVLIWARAERPSLCALESSSTIKLDKKGGH